MNITKYIYFTACAVMLTNSPAMAAAEPEHVTANEIDNSIREVMQRPEYTWRAPRERKVDEASGERHETILDRFFKSVGETLKGYTQKIASWSRMFEKWLDKFFKNKKPKHHSAPNFHWQDLIKILSFILLASSCAILGIYIYRACKNSYKINEIIAQPVLSISELPDDGLTAKQLPYDEWQKIAYEMLAKKEFRMALRAFFLSSLARLSDEKLLFLAKHKSNRDFLRDLERRAHDRPGIITSFAANVLTVEKVWYGSYPASELIVDQFRRNIEVIFNEQAKD